jgi:hypothetical protein
MLIDRSVEPKTNSVRRSGIQPEVITAATFRSSERSRRGLAPWNKAKVKSKKAKGKSLNLSFCFSTLPLPYRQVYRKLERLVFLLPFYFFTFALIFYFGPARSGFIP